MARRGLRISVAPYAVMLCHENSWAVVLNLPSANQPPIIDVASAKGREQWYSDATNASSFSQRPTHHPVRNSWRHLASLVSPSMERCGGYRIRPPGASESHGVLKMNCVTRIVLVLFALQLGVVQAADAPTSEGAQVTAWTSTAIATRSGLEIVLSTSVVSNVSSCPAGSRKNS